MDKRVKGSIFVFLGACSFGVLSTIVKIAYSEGYTLGHITGSQSFLGMLLLWILYLLQKKLFPTRSTYNTENKGDIRPKTAWWKVCAAGMFTGLVGIFYYQCVKLLPASISIILLMQYLWISIVIEAIIFKKKPTRIQLIAVCIVLIGTVFAGGVFNESLTLNPTGVAFGFLAALAYALFLITSGRVGNELPALKKGALMITGSCILTFIIFPPLFFFDGVLFDGLYKWGLALAVFGTVIPPLFFSIGIPKTGVSLGAIFSTAELPVAVLSSYLILRENVALLQWMGVVIILMAIVLPNLKSLTNRKKNRLV
ncbi:EamA family transporter [Dysgonomonas sp. ZJ709]|uniref:EamA family transporter n=1 Tax=Dysgonomonas sp. ZJ709 TaxID=2709797 RepID=UPI0013EBE3A3|nr:DMT family transporter [Dysgonomonas sp. ZJ709]